MRLLRNLVSGFRSIAGSGNPLHEIGEKVAGTFHRVLSEFRKRQVRAECDDRQHGSNHQHDAAIRHGFPGDLNFGPAGH